MLPKQNFNEQIVFLCKLIYTKYNQLGFEVGSVYTTFYIKVVFKSDLNAKSPSFEKMVNDKNGHNSP